MWTHWPCADTVKSVLTPIYSFISTLTGLIVTQVWHDDEVIFFGKQNYQAKWMPCGEPQVHKCPYCLTAHWLKTKISMRPQAIWSLHKVHTINSEKLDGYINQSYFCACSQSSGKLKCEKSPQCISTKTQDMAFRKLSMSMEYERFH